MKKLSLLAAMAACALAGCGDRVNENGATANGAAAAPGTPRSGTIGTLATADPALGKLGRIVGAAGMAELLNGVGPYTLFAPNDAALDGIGAGRADELAGEALRPQAVALLRAHIVPGTVTRQDIETGLNASSGPVTVRTMGETVLTFSRDGDGIIVTSDRGGRARLSGDEKIASNGAVQPLDGVLLATE